MTDTRRVAEASFWSNHFGFCQRIVGSGEDLLLKVSHSYARLELFDMSEINCDIVCLLQDLDCWFACELRNQLFLGQNHQSFSHLVKQSDVLAHYVGQAAL